MTRKKKEAEEQVVESVPTISEETSGLGTIRINHSVIAGIVRLATQSVEGVVNVGGGGVVEGLTDFFSKKESERGVKVSEVEGGGYDIEVRVVLQFGVDLAKNIDVVIDDIKMDLITKDDEDWASESTS